MLKPTDLVTLAASITTPDGMLPAGTTGVVQGVWSGCKGYAVEFTDPFPAQVTVTSDNILFEPYFYGENGWAVVIRLWGTWTVQAVVALTGWAFDNPKDWWWWVAGPEGSVKVVFPDLAHAEALVRVYKVNYESRDEPPYEIGGW